MDQDPKTTTAHMIGNAHLDPVWLWRWTEGYEALVATYRAALDFLRETETFIFTSSSAAMYAWIEESEREMFEEIRGRVQEGRWHIVGGWWIQPDCNIPAGESFVRQALYGQHYFRDKLNVTATVGYNVDSFGHACTLPQLLAKAGLLFYIFFRPGRHEKDLSEEIFWWEAPDGSRVLAHRPPGHYPYADDDMYSRVRQLGADRIRDLRDVAIFYGVGNHGGGPTRAQIEKVRIASRDPTLPRLVFGRLDRFFEQAQAQRQDYPVLRDELQHHARGCYTVHTGVKRWNREAEASLGTAEAFSTLAAELATADYPHAALTQAWQDVLFNQFHDILAGTSLPEAYEDARDLYGEARTLAGRALWIAVQALARRADTRPPFAGSGRGEGQAILVFNPLPWPARRPVQVDLPFGGSTDLRLVGRDGEPIAQQLVGGSCLISSGKSMRLLCLEELPPLGHRLYFLRRRDAAASQSALNIGPGLLENAYWRLEIGPSSGHIVGLYDKHRGVDVFSGPAAVPLVLEDRSDTWGHDVVAYRDAIGRFDRGAVRIEESGPVRAALRATSTYKQSTIAQTFRLYRDSPRIEVNLELDWHEQFRMLKLAFPVNVSEPVTTSSVPYGHLVREASGDEEPCGPWVDVSGRAERHEGSLDYGLALITDSKHGYDTCGSEIRLSVLRSPIYAWHDPARPEPDREYLFMDQGRSLLQYWLVPHAGPWQDADVVRDAMAINRPPIVVNEFGHEGAAPDVWTGAEAGPENIILSALKRAEDRDGIIVRLWETAGRTAQAWVKVPELSAEWQGAIGAHEIKTLRLRMTANGEHWEETDLLEM